MIKKCIAGTATTFKFLKETKNYSNLERRSLERLMAKGWVDHKNSTFPVFCLGVFLWHGINNQTQILTYLNCVLSVTE